MKVFWEDEPTREREVVRGCRVCRSDPEHPMIVSPTGLAHDSEGHGVTACGKDATGPEWWWRV